MKCNKENVRRAIKVMEAVPEERFDINFWTNECGAVACFAGWLAISEDIPEITFDDRDGETPSYYDSEFDVYSKEHRAIADFLNISAQLAARICSVDDVYCDEYNYEYISHFYNKSLNEITPQDVIKKLEELLED